MLVFSVTASPLLAVLLLGSYFLEATSLTADSLPRLTMNSSKMTLQTAESNRALSHRNVYFYVPLYH